MNLRKVEHIAGQLWGLFSLQQLQLYEPNFLRSNLTRRHNQWYIRRITKWWYDLNIPLNEYILFRYSNRIYTPSYISMESALRYYDLIPEWVYITTACTTKKTQTFQWNCGMFRYAHIKTDLMRWYDIVSRGMHQYIIARPHKAICDFFYLKSHIKTQQDVVDLRIDLDHLLTLTTVDTLRYCASQFNTKRVVQLVDFLLSSPYSHD